VITSKLKRKFSILWYTLQTLTGQYLSVGACEFKSPDLHAMANNQRKFGEYLDSILGVVDVDNDFVPIHYVIISNSKGHYFW
jgi:hypothetical protein